MANWEFAGYPHCATGRLKAAQVPGSLVNFPVVFRAGDLPDDLLDPSSSRPANAIRKNIIFGIKSTTPSSGEWERVPVDVVDIVLDTSPSGREAEIWVLFPSVSFTIDTEYKVCWGGDGNNIESFFSPYSFQAVWSGANYLSVYHMNDLTSSSIFDSGPNGITGTKLNGANEPSEVSGVIGKAQSFNDSLNQEIELSGFLGAPNFSTMSAWIKPDLGDTGSDEVFSLGDNLAIRKNGTTSITCFYRYSGGWRNIVATGNFTGNNHHILFTRQNNDQKIFIDGVLAASAIFSDSIQYSQGSNSYIGKHGVGSSAFFQGLIDEVRLSNDIKNADWALAEFNNQKENSTFIDNDNNPSDNILPTKIKMVHSGSAIISSGQTNINIPIGATVERIQSFILFTFRVNTDIPDQYLIRGSLNGTSTLDFDRGGSGSEVNIEWQVIEWTEDSAVRILRANNVMSSLVQNIGTSITFNPSNTFVIPSFSDGGSGWGGNEAIKWSINSTGDLTTMERAVSSLNMNHHIQLITHHNLKVTQIPYSNAGQIFNTSISSVNLNKSLVFASSMHSPVVGFREVGVVSFDSSTSIRTEKYLGGSTIEGFFYLLEFLDDTIVSGFITEMGAGINDLPDDIYSKNDSSFVFWGSTAYAFQSSNTSNDDMESSGVALKHESPNNLSKKRTSSGHSARMNIWLLRQAGVLNVFGDGLINNGLTTRGRVQT